MSFHFLRQTCAESISTLFRFQKLETVPWSVFIVGHKNSYRVSRRNFSNISQSRLRRMPTQQTSTPPVITISVDGNISSGKSTLVANLKELFPNKFNFKVDLIPEPLEKWTNVQGHNLLGLFYEDRTKNNFMFQHYVQLTRLMEEVKKPAEMSQGTKQIGTVRILERSLQNNRYCFTELARREGCLQPEEFAVLSEWHSWLEKQFDLTLDVIVYLRTDPETVYNRMQKRGRSEESSVPLDYLKNLHDTYEKWLIKDQIGSVHNTLLNQESHEMASNNGTSRTPSKQRIIVIDGNKGIDEVAEECKSRLQTFMKELQYIDDTQANSKTKQVDVCLDIDALA